MANSAPEILWYFGNRIQIAKAQQLKKLDLSVPWNTHQNDKLHRIPQEIFELTHLESLDLSGNEITEIPTAINQLTNLTTLDLGLNRIDTIPKAITQLANLTTFKVSLNRITEIPECITQLKNLTTLDLGLNKITEIPECITQLKNLTTLDLGENRIAVIPEHITELVNLTALDLSKNAFNDIPTYITQLTNLSSLDLSRNHLKSLPDFVGNLANLASLYLSRNGITVIPEFIGKLKNLKHLDLSHNEIRAIPEFIGELANLSNLDLSSNRIITTPKSMEQLAGLVSLNLSHNELKTIPDSIFPLENLIDLDLSFNLIDNISQSITRLTSLNRIDLTGNKLATFPEFIFKLNNLSSLRLSQNRIRSIPDFNHNLANLTCLFLSSNQLNSIPSSLTKLTNLKELILSDNNILTIPKFLSKFTNLVNLNLSNNRITDIPNSLGKSTKLTNLDLSSNQIKSIPKSIGQLVNLASLNVSENKIIAIPDTIRHLTNLSYLDLTGNQITAIPDSINQLPNLIKLSLDDNEIEIPPLEIANQGIKSIRNYFLQLNDGEDYIYEAKLIIVGEGGAGKTTLAKKICNPNYELQPDEASTEGINVITWKFNLLEQKEHDFQVNIWDFGGQEIYHATHQFFLTKRSLYILVADTRKEDTDFYYWMNVVELLADDSPILIVKNEKQDRHCEIDERRLRGEFINLKEIIATNLKTKRDLDLVVDNVKHYIQQLPHVGTTLPKTWIEVRKKLEELKDNGNNYISLDTYIDICNEHGFDKYENALQLSQYLHDLGVCLYFREDPLLSKTIILQPEWGTDAVYKVLDDDIVVRNLGRFSKQNLTNIWSDSKYLRMHNELLQLMIKFKLCYEITEESDNFIAPQLLSLSQPEYDWNSAHNLLLRYSYEFMPKGILTRFIVEVHNSIFQNLVWRSGVVIANNYAQAEVVEYYDNKEIRIRICGDHKRDLMAIIINEIDKINFSYERIKFNKLIPCNCASCLNSSQPSFYPLPDLKARLAHKKEHIECSHPPYHQVRVLSLITDISTAEIEPDINQSSPRIIQNIYGNVEHVTGNIAGNQIRNIDLNQGNYNESISGNYVDMQSLEYKSAQVAEIVNQLPHFEPNSEQQQLKILLSQLQKSIFATNLDDEDREDALEQIQAIAKAIPNHNHKKSQRKARSSWGIIQDIAASLPDSSPMVIVSSQLAQIMKRLFGAN